MRQLIIDCETTGFTNTDRIIEFCALELRHGVLTGNKLHLFFNPDCEISDGAYKCHGYKLSELQDKPLFSDCIHKILDFCFGVPWIIHNAPFDIRFLKNEFGRLGLTLHTLDNYIIDTLTIAKDKLPNIKHSLDSLCDHFRIPKPEKHGALADCQRLYEVYKYL